MPSSDHLPALADRPAKPFRVGRKLDRSLDALITGEAKTVKAAAELGGMVRETLSRHLARPEVQAEIERRVRKLMGGTSLARAHGVLNALLDAESEHVRFKAAELILAVNGLRPPPAGVNVQVNNNYTPGWVIDLREDKDAPAVVELGGDGSMTLMNGERYERRRQAQQQIIDVTPTTIEGTEP